MTDKAEFNIYNAQWEKQPKKKEEWEDKQVLLLKIQDRFTKMKSEREPFEAERDYIDAQVNSKSFYDNDWRLIVNCAVEQNLLEIHKGRTSGKLNFDVTSVWVVPDNEEEKSAKYVLNEFLDRENRWAEYETREYDRGKYGTAFFANFMQMNRVKNYIYSKKTIEDEIGNWYYDKAMIETFTEKWKFMPRNRPIRQVYIDDWAVRQSKKERIKDIILVETVDFDEFKIRFNDKKLFDIEWVEALTTNDAEYWVISTKDKVVLWYYYDIINKDYAIIANKEKKVYSNKYTGDELPISIAPYRFRSDCIYGYGLPRIVRNSKRYKNMIMQAMVDGSILASRVALIMGNTDFVDGDPQMNQLVNTWRTTGDSSQVQPMNLSNNLNYLTNVLGIIEQEIRTDSGIDPNAMFEAPAQQLWTVEIIEENKAIRFKAIDQCRDLAIDDSFTQSLNNIVKYAPALLRETEEVEWVTTTKSRPLIKVPNIKVVMKDGKRYFEEDYGNYWTFELKPRTKTWDLLCRVVTPSSLNNNSIALSKNRNKEFMTTLGQLALVYGPQEITKVAPFDEVRRMTKQDYGYGDKLQPQTNLDINKKKQLDAIEQIKAFTGLTLNPQQDVQANPAEQVWQAPQWQPWTAAAAGQIWWGQAAISPNPESKLWF